MSAEEVIAQHRKLWTDTIASCSGCDWSQFGTITRTDLAHAAHQLDALKAGGYVVVDLPSPSSTSDGRYTAGWDVLGGHDWVRVDCFGRVEDAGGATYSPDEAREFAAALLAAANHAEATS